MGSNQIDPCVLIDILTSQYFYQYSPERGPEPDTRTPELFCFEKWRFDEYVFCFPSTRTLLIRITVVRFSFLREIPVHTGCENTRRDGEGKRGRTGVSMEMDYRYIFNTDIHYDKKSGQLLEVGDDFQFGLCVQEFTKWPQGTIVCIVFWPWCHHRSRCSWIFLCLTVNHVNMLTRYVCIHS